MFVMLSREISVSESELNARDHVAGKIVRRELLEPLIPERDRIAAFDGVRGAGGTEERVVQRQEIAGEAEIGKIAL
jgi:hypothetical protein